VKIRGIRGAFYAKQTQFDFEKIAVISSLTIRYEKLQFCNFQKNKPKQTQTNPKFWL
jgi:hypothetical protein